MPNKKIEISREKVNRERIIREFMHLVSYDSESYHEAELAAYLKKELKALGLEITEDDAGEKLKDRTTDGTGCTSNIYGRLKGNVPGEAVLFAAHMDTVKPGKGKKAVLHEDGRITARKDTVLGADDLSGIVSILEALRVIRENQLQHPDLEILFTAAEEPYCEGSRYLDYSRIASKMGYVLDLTGPVGIAAVSAPSIFSIQIETKGKAAHAGFAPEDGINALNIVVNALGQIQTGHVDERTTVNFGVIHGGKGKNIIPDFISLEGEIRSFSNEKAETEVLKIQNIFEKEAERLGGAVKVTVTRHIKAYRIKEEEAVVERFKRAAGVMERCLLPECITTYGGSDANRLNEHGIQAIVLACAMENCHSLLEYTMVDELAKSAELTLNLMTVSPYAEDKFKRD